MQEVLAIPPLPGDLDRARLRNGLWSDPCHHFTVVQETEIVGIWNYRYRIITGRNDHTDRCQ